MNDPVYWNIKELTERFKCSKRTIYRWMSLEDNPFPRPKIDQKGVSCLWSIAEVVGWENSMSDAA